MKIVRAIQIVLLVLSIFFLVLSILSDNKDTTYLSIALSGVLIANVINIIAARKKNS